MRHATLVGSLLIALLTASVIHADTVKTLTSGDFILGYGYTDSTAGWCTTETAGANVSPTGDFTVTPALTGGYYSTGGATFPDRVLTNGAYDYSANIGDFFAPIAAQYTGAAPADASATPNYQLTLEITGIQIYAGGYLTTNAQWEETTPGYTATGPLTTDLAQFLPDTPSKTSAYSHLVWDPTDYAVAQGLNDTFTRTFQIAPFAGADRYGDGFEVFGRVSLSYNAVVPEPSTLVLACAGIVGLLAYAWRKRR